ncbi:MAG: VOC family protein [Myxococcota bacterium]
MSQGRFCWHDLMTTKPDAGREFYGALLGWTFTQEDMGEGGPYTMIHDGTEATGGIVKMSEDDGLPSHWMLYVTVDDCEAAVAKAKSLGGACHVGPLDIPGTGRFAVLADDQGAYFSVIALKNEGAEKGPDARPANGQFCWYTVAVGDPAKAKAFYGALFGWECLEMSMGGDAKSEVFKRNGLPIAGIGPLNGAPTAYWSTAIAVDDLDAKHEKAIGLGATGLMPPMDLGTMGRMSLITDPAGATITLFQWVG